MVVSRSLVALGTKMGRFSVGDDHGRWSAFREFMESFDDDMSVVERADAISGRPELLECHEWNVFLGALGEHLASANGFTMPEWVYEPERSGVEELWEPLDNSSWGGGPPIEECPPLFLGRGILVATEDFGMSVIPSAYCGRMVSDMSDEEIEGLRRSVAMLTPEVRGVTRELALGLFDEVQRLRQLLHDKTTS